MPGQLANGEVVDVWARGQPVAWTLPSKAARGGRWRSFPMASEAEGASSEELSRVYGYFCHEWNRGRARPGDDGACVMGKSGAGEVASGVANDTDPGRRLVRLKAYMLRAPLEDVSMVTKRHLHTQVCP
jgi:hypothetical protein